MIGEVPIPKVTTENPPVTTKPIATGTVVTPKLVRQLSLPGVQGWRPQGWCHLDISPDGKTLAARNGSTVELWDLDTGKRRADLSTSAHAQPPMNR